MRQIICPRLCRYHKPGQEETPGCGGLEWLLERPEFYPAVERLEPQEHEPLFGLDPDDPRLMAICRGCDFLVDGCDFRDPAVDPADCAPCGGLRAIAGLLARGRNLGLK